MIVLLQMFCWFWQWNKFENQSIFDEIKAYKTKGVNFLDHPVYGTVPDAFGVIGIAIPLVKKTGWW